MNSFSTQEVSPRSKRVRFSDEVYFCEQHLKKSLNEMERQQQQQHTSPREKDARPTNPHSLFICSSECGTTRTIQGQNDYYSSSLSMLGYKVKSRTVPL